MTRIRNHPLVPGWIPIYGYVYDVRSGRLLEVAEASWRAHATLAVTGFARWLEDLIEAGQIADTRRAAILVADDPYGSSIARHFEEEAQALDWEITGQEVFTAGQVADWGPLLSRVRRDDVSVLVTTTFSPADNAAMAQQFVENPMPAVLYQQYGPSVPEYLELAGPAAEGVVWSTVLGRLPDPVGQAWVQAYTDKFGTEPGFANAPGMRVDDMTCWAFHPDCWEESPSFVDFLEGAA